MEPDDASQTAQEQAGERAATGQKLAILEQRILELEASHKAAIEKWTCDKQHLLEDIGKKNLAIDKMRIKLNRYEFSLKEAILFLSKPMDAYDIWLNNKSSESNNLTVITAIQGAMSAANHAYNPHVGQSTSPTTAGTPTERSRNASSAPIKSKINSNSSLAILTDSSSLSATAHTAPIVPKVGGATNLEIHCMECMRLSLNYLKNAQSSISAMDKDEPLLPPPAPLIPDPLQLLNIKPLDDALKDLKNSLDLGALGTHQLADSSSSNTSAKPSRKNSSQYLPSSPTAPARQNPLQASSAVAKSRALALARLNSPERRQSTQITNSALLRAATVQRSIFDEGDTGDIASSKQHSRKTSNPPPEKQSSVATSPEKSNHRTDCIKCRELMLQIDHTNDTVESLRSDIKILANQLEEERAIRDRNQLAKDILDQELEELTSQLFDQANKMVIDEARMRDELETSNRDLQGELKELVLRCEKREEELRELNRNIKALELVKMRSSVLSMNGGTNSQLGSLNNISALGSNSNLVPRGVSMHAYYSATSISSTSNKSSSQILVDGILLSEFQDHIRQAMSSVASPTNPNPAPSTVANETLFIKRSIVEDVEPCLFSSYPTLTPGAGGIFNASKAGKSTNGLLPIKKRLIDAFLKCQVEVVSNATESNEASSPSSPGSHTPSKMKCISCSLNRECDFKLRISDKSPADQFPLCVFCHDKVVVVSDFFNYMNQLRQGIIGPGKQGFTLLGMLRHAIWLKRRMGVSKVGNCGLFELDTFQTVDRKGDGEWEKYVHIIQ